MYLVNIWRRRERRKKRVREWQDPLYDDSDVLFILTNLSVFSKHLLIQWETLHCPLVTSMKPSQLHPFVGWISGYKEKPPYVWPDMFQGTHLCFENILNNCLKDFLMSTRL